MFKSNNISPSKALPDWMKAELDAAEIGPKLELDVDTDRMKGLQD
jgi:hypothetical protein